MYEESKRDDSEIERARESTKEQATNMEQYLEKQHQARFPLIRTFSCCIRVQPINHCETAEKAHTSGTAQQRKRHIKNIKQEPLQSHKCEYFR